MQKLLIILACVPITPIVVGGAALYRKWTQRRERTEMISGTAMSVID